MRSIVETRLWNIFTYYTVHGDPLDPDHLNNHQFVRFAKDCEIIHGRVTIADIQVTFASQVHSKKNKHKTSKKTNLLSYNGFLNSLAEIAKKCYPRAATASNALESLLEEKILPLASHREPESIDHILSSEEILILFEYFEKPIFEIFQFYASDSKGEDTKEDTSINDDMSSIFRQNVNSMKECMSYQGFIKFSNDFGLSSNVLLSTMEIADIFLCSVKLHSSRGLLRKLSYIEFWECIVRCALTTYDKVSDANPTEKLKGLFLLMWRALQQKVPRAIELRRDVCIYSGDLLAGAMCFNNRFTAQWRKDGFKDYISEETEERQRSGTYMIHKLLKSSSSAKALESSMYSSASNTELIQEEKE